MATPTGSMPLAQHHLRLSIADSESFRAWVGAADQSEALARVYSDALPLPDNGNDYTRAELEAIRPFALVSTDPQNGYRRTIEARGSGSTFNAEGLIGVVFEADVAALDAEDPEAAGVNFRNEIEAVVDDCWAVNGTAGYLAFEDAQIVGGPERSPRQAAPTEGDFYWVMYEFRWEGI